MTKADEWMSYTKYSRFKTARETCPYSHRPDEYCSTCMLMTRAMEKAYHDGYADAESLKGNGGAVLELLVALEATTDELQRLRYVLLPHYEGKIGEPDGEVLAQALEVAWTHRGGQEGR